MANPLSASLAAFARPKRTAYCSSFQGLAWVSYPSSLAAFCCLEALSGIWMLRLLQGQKYVFFALFSQCCSWNNETEKTKSLLHPRWHLTMKKLNNSEITGRTFSKFPQVGKNSNMPLFKIWRKNSARHEQTRMDLCDLQHGSTIFSRKKGDFKMENTNFALWEKCQRHQNRKQSWVLSGTLIVEAALTKEKSFLALRLPRSTIVDISNRSVMPPPA